MVELEYKVTIERPPQEVFAFLSDPANDPKWQVGTLETRQVSEGPVGVETAFRQVARSAGRRWEVTYTLTEYEPPVRSALEGRIGGVRFAGSYSLEPADSGTRLTVSGGMTASGPMRLALPLLAPVWKRDAKRSFPRLKAALETKGER